MTLRAASMIPKHHLQVVENNEVTKVLDFILHKATGELHEISQEYLYALMAIDHATRHPPQDLLQKLETKL
jgi:hypothetical protein